MKVVFVGPSHPKASDVADASIVIRPPACQGDVMQAVEDGATAIGLIDGQFATAAPVWHKELLFALSKGVAVYGAASMGALRAAECVAYGMIGVGKIFDDYASGARVDDADVALLFGPAELGYPPLSIPLVNAQATIDNILRLGLMDGGQCQKLHRAAVNLFFKRRTWKSVADVAGVEWEILQHALASAKVDQKKLDATKLLEVFSGDVSPPRRPAWQFHATPLFRRMYLKTS